MNLPDWWLRCTVIITEQFSFFNEAKANCSDDAPGPSIEEIVCLGLKAVRRTKKKGQKEENLKNFPQEEISHDVPEERLIRAFGENSYKSMSDEVFWQMRFEPARWIAGKHIIKVYVGTDRIHQDEFLRGDRLPSCLEGAARPHLRKRQLSMQST